MNMSGHITRRSFLCSAAVALVAVPLEGLAKAIDVDHGPKIKPVNQGNANLCWLASAAMLVSAKRGMPITMATLAKELGAPYDDLYTAGQQSENGGALSTSLVKPLADRLRMKTDGLKSFTVDAWAAKIGAGPIFVAGFTEGAKMGHAVVITGLIGDTTKYEELKVRLIDPDGAKPKVQNFKETIKFYEGLASAGVPQLLFF